MNNDIKEILDDMKQIPIDESWALNLEDYQCKLLLNYITNLQKENKELQTSVDNCKQENEKLKIECFQLENIDYLEEINREKVLRKINDEIKDDYKQRNEKAVELIKKALIESDITGNGTLDINNLLSILQGGDEE